MSNNLKLLQIKAAAEGYSTVLTEQYINEIVNNLLIDANTKRLLCITSHEATTNGFLQGCLYAKRGLKT